MEETGNNNNKRALPAQLGYLIALCAATVFMYDAALSSFGFDNTDDRGSLRHAHTDDAEIVIDENFYQISEQHMAKARRLNVRERILEITKSTWPECVVLEMTPVQCKEFIDEEIMTLFSEEDRYIQTRIIPKRSEADEWYNCVVIGMDDNDIVLGRNGDGLVYYDFEWYGSGSAATPEQETEIPPITAVETAAGAAAGSQVETIYKSTPATPLVSATTAATTAAQIEQPDDPVTTGATTTGATTTVITTTVTTTTAAPFSTTVMPIDPVVMVESPVTVEGEAIMVVGSTVDEVMAGTATNPINGGVVLDPSAPTTEEGTAKLNEALADDSLAEIATAGPRVLEPFDCKGMNGFECCLMIKHTVRDADIYGRAMQCFLDYEESTCKKEWWREILETKRVMIYENDNGMISQTPKVEGEWPSCNDKWGTTRDYNNPPCEPHVDFDLCFALDHSGSVCSASNPKLCTDCSSSCQEDGFDTDTCCNNYSITKLFAQRIIERLDVYNVQTEFSLVKFSTSSQLVGGYETGTAAISALGDMTYTGGYTNHQNAIRECEKQLLSANPFRKKFMMIVTDGVSTRPSWKAKYKAERAATRAKRDGITIVPVFIDNTGNDVGAVDFMGKLSSTDDVFDADGFGELEGLISTMVRNIACSAQ